LLDEFVLKGATPRDAPIRGLAVAASMFKTVEKSADKPKLR
jgi:hypothetical protein